MKINVNEYNEILSYEGTPVELAEFIATGILDPYMYEDCGCEEEYEPETDESVIVPDAMDDDVIVTTIDPCESEESVDPLDTYKESVREQLEAEGYYCSDEGFEDAYKVAVEIMGPLKDLFK